MLAQFFLQLQSLEHLADTDDEFCEGRVVGGGLKYAAVNTIVQLVGVYLLFATLIMPALAGRPPHYTMYLPDH